MLSNNQFILQKAFVLVVMLLASICTTLAQEEKLWFSLGADVLVPVGKLKTEVLVGYGGSANISLYVSPQFALTVSIGFASFEGKSDSLASFRGVPIRGGLKFYLLRQKAIRIYSTSEAGAFFLSNKQGTSVGFGIAPILGFESPIGARANLDVSIRYDCFFLKQVPGYPRLKSSREFLIVV